MFRSIRTKVHKALWSNKRRKVATIISTAALVAATAAVAYFLALATGSGDSTPSTLGGSGTQPVVVSVVGDLNDMKPGDTKPFTVSALNNGTNIAQVNAVTVTVVGENGLTIPPGTFTVTQSGITPPRQVGAGNNAIIDEGTIKFNDNGDQTALAGGHVHVHAEVNPAS